MAAVPEGRLFGALSAAVPEGRLFGLDGQTVASILIQLLNAAILAAALSLILYRPVLRFMRGRSEGIRSQMERAAADMAEAMGMKALYERKLTEAELERVEILERARQLATEKGHQTLMDAKREVNAMWERALAGIELERERAEEQMRLRIIEVSSLMAERLIERSMDRALQDRLYDDVMTELEGLSWPS
ncbi:MAG: ATP synthase F0 subunit B [Oscillospiraceae bacterium]|nr:ATP synthase F0 subunit B [Oscillospiraceae bacterium]